jgi:hypothetical protein
MNEPSPNLILYPVFAMFYLVAAVLVRLAYLRVGAVGRREVDAAFYKTYQCGEEPEHIRVVTRHFINLFEVPVIFYVTALIAFVTHQAGYWLIGCAWAYVVLRYLHSYVHLTSNDVLTRFRLYIASGVVLLVMWSSVLAQLALGR